MSEPKYVVEAIGSEAKHIIELLQAEAEGRLTVLPCKVGDTVYVNKECLNDWYFFLEFKPFVRAEVVNFKYGKKGIIMNLRPLTERTANTRYHEFFPLSSINKTVFLKKEEADKFLFKARGESHE